MATQNVPDVTPDLPSGTWRTVLALLGRLPERSMSRGFGRIADTPLPRAVRRRVLGTFARSVGVDLSEVELPLEEYPTLNAFFVRRLKPDARSWPSSPTVVASPVDGILGRSGRITKGRAIQAKGHDYSVSELLGDAREAERYEGGSFVTLYLSPRHYHRIHAPAPGIVRKATHIPGALLPVNAAAVMHVPHLFARNERLICHLDGERGRIAVVAVGAYNVGRISAAFDPMWDGTGSVGWVTNRRSAPSFERSYDPPRRVGIGEEIMAFHLGSTVVLLLEAGPRLRPDAVSGQEVRLGQPLLE